MPTRRKSVRKDIKILPQVNKFKENILNPKNKKLSSKKIGIILILLVVFFFLGTVFYKNKSFLFAAILNNMPITSIELNQRLAKQYGKQTLDQMIVEKLIIQDAANNKVVVTDTEINGEIDKIKQSLNGNSLDDLLVQQGMTLDELKYQVKLRLIATKLVSKNITVTDDEVNKYITDNKANLSPGADPAAQKEEVKKYLLDQKTSQAIQEKVQELKTKSKVSIFL